MVTNRRPPIPLAALLCLIAGSALPGEKKDFGARWKEAEQNVRSGPGDPYFNNVFFKEFLGKYATHMTECTQRTGEKTMTPLHAAVELGARGQVLRVMVRPETKPTKYFAALVKRDTGSRWPAAVLADPRIASRGTP